MSYETKTYEEKVQKYKTAQSHNLSIPVYYSEEESWKNQYQPKKTNFLNDYFNSCLSNDSHGYGYHFVEQGLNERANVLYSPNSYYVLKDGYFDFDKPRFLQHEDVAVVFAEVYNSELGKFEKSMLITKPYQDPYILKLGSEFYEQLVGYTEISHHFDENHKFSMTLAVNSINDNDTKNTVQKVYQFSEDSQELKLLFQHIHKDNFRDLTENHNLSYHIVGQPFECKNRMYFSAYDQRSPIPLASIKSFNEFSPLINGSGVLPLDIMFNEENAKGIVDLLASYDGKGIRYSKFEAIFNLDGSHLLIKPSEIEFMSDEIYTPVLFGIVVNLMDFLKAVVEKTTNDVSQYAKPILEQNKYMTDFFEVGAIGTMTGWCRLAKKPFRLICEPFHRTFIFNCYDTAENTTSKTMRGIAYCNDDGVQYKTVGPVLKSRGDEKKDIVLFSGPLGEYDIATKENSTVWLYDPKRSFVFMSENYYKMWVVDEILYSKPQQYSPIRYAFTKDEAEKSPYFESVYKNFIDPESNLIVNQFASMSAHYKINLTNYKFPAGNVYWKMFGTQNDQQYRLRDPNEQVHQYKSEETTLIDPTQAWNLNKYKKYKDVKCDLLKNLEPEIESTQSNQSEISIQPAVSSFRKR